MIRVNTTRNECDSKGELISVKEILIYAKKEKNYFAYD